jgi:hypothetical protein
MLHFQSELKRQGWEDAQIAIIHSGYSRSGGTVKPTGSQFATLFADLDGDHRAEWIVGCYVPSKAAPVPDPGMTGMTGRGGMIKLRDDRARVAVFKKREDGWRLEWISPGLGFEFHAPEHNLQEVVEGLSAFEHLGLPLSLSDVDADGRLEIVYHCWSESDAVGALPGIYRFDGNRWVNTAPQADRFTLRDVDGDGKQEVITGTRFIGFGSGDDDVPRVWRWSGRQFQEASADFPQFYADLANRYRSYVSRKEGKGESFDRPAWERAIRKVTSLAT